MKETPLKRARERANLTQSQLAEMSAVSLRTIQRAEAGQVLKGFTLKALAKALEVSEEELLGEQDQEDLAKVKQINLSALSFFVFPFANVFVPAYLTYSSKSSSVKAMGKKIVEMQIAWFLLFALALILTPWIHSLVGAKSPIIFVVITLFVLLNVALILANASRLNRTGNLAISLKINFL